MHTRACRSAGGHHMISITAGGPYRNKKQQPMHIKMTFLPVRPYPAERGHLGVRCCVGFSQIAREPKWCTSNISSQLARTIRVHRPPRRRYVCATLNSVEGSLEHGRHNFRWRSRRFPIAICWPYWPRVFLSEGVLRQFLWQNSRTHRNNAPCAMPQGSEWSTIQGCR